MQGYYQNYIGGQWVDGSTGDRLAIEDLATGEVFAEVTRAMPADVGAAVTAAHACADQRLLIDVKPMDRGRYLVDMARWMLESPWNYALNTDYYHPHNVGIRRG